MQLVWPALEHLPSYARALAQGWTPDPTARGPVTARQELARIEADPAAFVASLVDREARGVPITLPDGSQVPRLPGYHRWMWDDDASEEDGGGFCGSIGFRWQPATSALPLYVLGHIGYAVVPWRRSRGHATLALALLLADV